MTYSSYPQQRSSSPLALVLAGAALVLTVWLVLDRAGVFQPAPTAEPRAVAPRGELSQYEQDVIRVFQESAPSVAHITTESLVRTRWGGVGTQQGSGSGFVWDESGTVVTNYHVVKNAGTVTVSIQDERFTADVLEASPGHDLAVLRLRGNASGLKPLPLGTSADLQVGQAAIAIGNPFGFDQTLTTGIVSALNRTITTEDGTQLSGLIQVDAAINPGNSGGPLLDSYGRLVGVTTAIYSPSGASAGLGFAVPVDVVNTVVPNLIAGRGTLPVLGVRSAYETMNLDPRTGYRSGAIVTEIVPGFGAEAAGLRPFEVVVQGRRSVIRTYGDIIVEIDGQKIRGFFDLPGALKSRVPGDVVKVKVLRGYPDDVKLVELEVALKSQ